MESPEALNSNSRIELQEPASEGHSERRTGEVPGAPEDRQFVALLGCPAT